MVQNDLTDSNDSDLFRLVQISFKWFKKFKLQNWYDELVTNLLIEWRWQHMIDDQIECVTAEVIGDFVNITLYIRKGLSHIILIFDRAYEEMPWAKTLFHTEE